MHAIILDFKLAGLSMPKLESYKHANLRCQNFITHTFYVLNVATCPILIYFFFNVLIVWRQETTSMRFVAHITTHFVKRRMPAPCKSPSTNFHVFSTSSFCLVVSGSLSAVLTGCSSCSAEVDISGVLRGAVATAIFFLSKSGARDWKRKQ